MAKTWTSYGLNNSIYRVVYIWYKWPEHGSDMSHQWP